MCVITCIAEFEPTPEQNICCAAICFNDVLYIQKLSASCPVVVSSHVFALAYVEVRDSRTGYLVPGHDGSGLWPDGRVVGTSPSPSPSSPSPGNSG